MQITKGKSYTVRTAFKKKGIALTFANPPVWRLYSSDGKVLMNGVASADGSRWAASFTIPNSYTVPGGSEDLEVEFIGFSGSNEYSRSKEITLLDEAEDFRTTGIIYNAITRAPIRDSIVLPYDTLEYIQVSVNSPYNTQLYAHPTISAPVYTSRTTRGYEYQFSIGSPTELMVATNYNEPVQLIIQAKTAGIDDPFLEIHSLYPLTNVNAGLVNALQNYLDKARLTEIDPTLQWRTDEYLHYLNEGISYINGAGVTATFWTVANYPSSLRSFLMYAAAWHGLNARYLAEGFNAFNFQGLNTNLEFDRRSAIEYKISELQTILDKINPAKAAAINAFGIGIPPADSGQLSNADANSGVLGISISPNTNRRGYRGRQTLFRGY